MQQINHNENIIEVENVPFAYNGEHVLKDITLHVHKGDYLGIVGPNGGGKTTLLKCILGLLKPQEGSIKVFGQDINSFNNWPQIGYVPQRIMTFDGNFPATVEDVVSMGLYAKKGLFRFLNKQDKEVVQKALAQVDMQKYANRLISDLSGGQQQRVFIARALASEPQIIFLDEPTVGVDLQSQHQFYALLKELNHTLALTLVLVTHDIDVIAHEATEIACVDRHIQYHGSPEAFLKNDTHIIKEGSQQSFAVKPH